MSSNTIGQMFVVYEHLKTDRSRISKSQILNDLPENEKRLFANDLGLNGVGPKILESITEVPEGDILVSTLVETLRAASKVSSMNDKRHLLSCIVLSPELKKFVIDLLTNSLAIGATVKPFEVSLGMPFFPELCSKIKFDPSEMVVETKYNGIRMVAHKVDGEVKMFSRNGRNLVVEDIEKLLQDKLPDGTIVDGEVLGTSVNDLQEFKRHTKDVRYVVFDTLMIDGVKIDSDNLEMRKSQIPSGLEQSKVWNNFNTYDEMIQYLREHLELEGFVAKDPNSVYEVNKRSWIKLKLQHELTAIVTGFNLGTGKRTGTVGSINVTGSGFANTKVGTGFSDDDLSIIHRRLINGVPTMVDVAYSNKTKDGCLFHPIFLRIRDDLNV